MPVSSSAPPTLTDPVTSTTNVSVTSAAAPVSGAPLGPGGIPQLPDLQSLGHEAGALGGGEVSENIYDDPEEAKKIKDAQTYRDPNDMDATMNTPAPPARSSSLGLTATTETHSSAIPSTGAGQNLLRPPVLSGQDTGTGGQQLGVAHQA